MEQTQKQIAPKQQEPQKPLKLGHGPAVQIPETEEVLVKIKAAEKKRMVEVCRSCWRPTTFCDQNDEGVINIPEDDPLLHDGKFHGTEPSYDGIWETWRMAGKY